MDGVELGVLGSLRAVRDGRPLDLGPPGQRRLLAALLVRPGREVAPDVLADVLWGEDPPATARNIVHGYVSGLRRSLEPGRPARSEGRIIRSTPGGYVLDLPAERIDASRFERLAGHGRALAGTDPQRAAETLREGLDLWRGRAFDDVAGHPFAEAEAVRLEELRVQAYEAWAEAELALGRHERLVPRLRALVEEHRLREPLWALLMLALYRSGRQGDALAAYVSAGEALASEMGVDPGEALRSLHTRILTHDPSVRAPAARGNLPVPPSSFIGREAELDETREILDGSRLLTLTGAGGIGKTRLGLRLADAVRGGFADGVWWVDLAPVADPGLVAGTVASSLPGRAPAEGSVEGVVAKLRDRHLLLFLDNCEHLLEVCAQLAWAILRSCAGTSILATSRAPLGTEGEVAYHVPSLSLPSEGTGALLLASEAVRLFCDRARAGRPDFRLSEDNEAAVAAICTHLDGIPLAIELAAARIRVLSAREIADGLADRFSLLRGGAHEALPRHRTLEASVEWSERLLGPSERTLLHRLSAFAGSFDLDAVRAVCSDGLTAPDEILDLLSSLVDQSLVRAERTDERTRYRLLETIRQYAQRQLTDSDEEDAIRSRHLDHYLALAERREAPTAAMIDTLVARLQPEVDNLRAAMDHGLSTGQTEKTLRLAASASPLWLVRGNWSELLRWLDVAAGAEDAAPDVRAKALVAASSMAGYWDFRAMHAFAEQAVALARRGGDPRRLAQALAHLGYAAFAIGHPDAPAVLDEAIATARRTGHDSALVVATGVATLLADPQERRPLADEGVEAARRSGSAFTLAFALYHRARHVLLLGEGRAAESCEEFEKVLAITGPIGEMAYLSATLGTYLHAEVLRGNYEHARELGEQSVAAARTSGMRPAEGNAYQGQGYLAYATGDLTVARDCFERARELWVTVTNTPEEDNARLGLGLVAIRGGDLGRARDILKDVVRTRRAGGGWVLARALLGLARLSRVEGDADRSASFLAKALAILSERGDLAGLAEAFEAAAALPDAGDAALLLGAAERLREEIGYARFPVDRPGFEATLTEVRDRMGADAFDAAWAEGRALALDAAVARARLCAEGSSR